ncbi:YhfL family protein [Scandinavium sp. TWS1a]|uniref:YhfL family protein n=1 Tax=Scandinavium tedordense TaxID=2926521 RepID=UPI00135B915A|nr:YhfL family protein [Scandinavium tedordense]MCS2171180.1 YhfL family protein [Scandinavium tedordense]
MKRMIKIVALLAVVGTLTACSGHVENKNKSCGYDYLLHPAISISRIIGGCGPAEY